MPDTAAQQIFAGRMGLRAGRTRTGGISISGASVVAGLAAASNRSLAGAIESASVMLS
jgi:hypothetical protein